MIILTRLNGEEMMVNAELIEFIESTPDTVISMTSGKKFIVTEPLEIVYNRIVGYKQKINVAPQVMDNKDEMDMFSQ